MRSLVPWLSFLLVIICLAANWTEAQSYPAIAPLEKTFDVPDVEKANVVLNIFSVDGSPAYKLQCHSAGFAEDPDFDYSGDFECRLSSVGKAEKYSTLLTENENQSRDWENRGRFFAAALRGACADIPHFGANRIFELRGMTVVLHVVDPVFTAEDKLKSLRLIVNVASNPKAHSPIAEAVPLPKARAPQECRLKEYFVNPATFSKERK